MIDTRTAPFAAFALRLALGVMFIAHGLQKLLVFTPAGTAKFFDSVGFAGWMAYPVIGAEILGGIALVIGVFPRVVAALLTVVLLGATTVHLGNGWAFSAPHGGWEYPLFLAVSSFALALLGDGAFAALPTRRTA